MVVKRVGVLIVTHGGSLTDEWGELFLEAIREAAIPLPTKIAWLLPGKLAIPTLSAKIKSLVQGKLDEALESLEAEKLEKIVVVSFFVSSYGTEQDRLKYLLGLEPVPEGGPDCQGFDSRQILKPKEKIVLTPGMDDHPLVVEILLERALELTREPKNDAILIITRRSTARYLEQKKISLNSLADKLKEQGGFRDVRFGFVLDIKQSFVPDSIRNEETNNIQETVAVLNANVKGSVIVLPLFLSDGTLNREEVPRIIAGLGCLYNPKTLLPHRNVSRWLKEMVAKGVKG